MCVYLYAHQFCCLKTDLRQGSSRLIAVAKEKAQVCLYSQSFPSGVTIRLASGCQFLSTYKYVIKHSLNFLKIFLLFTLHNFSNMPKWKDSLKFSKASRWFQGKISPGSWFLNITQEACQHDTCLKEESRTIGHQWDSMGKLCNSLSQVPYLSSPTTSSSFSAFQPYCGLAGQAWQSCLLIFVSVSSPFLCSQIEICV